MVNSQVKGKRGELEWAARLREEGYEAQRTAQNRGSVDSFDVESSGPLPIKRWEVKRDKRLNPWKAMDHAREEAEGEAFALAWRKDRTGWLVVLDAEVFFELASNRS